MTPRAPALFHASAMTKLSLHVHLVRVQILLRTAGKTDALGPLDENEPDDAGEEDDDADDLADQLATSAKIS